MLHMLLNIGLFSNYNIIVNNRNNRCVNYKKLKFINSKRFSNFMVTKRLKMNESDDYRNYSRSSFI